MKKIIPALIPALLVLAFAGALFVRFLMHGESFAPGKTAVVSSPVNNDHPLVIWSVMLPGQDQSKEFSYSIVTKKTSGLIGSFEGPVGRFNQSTNVCNAPYVVSSLGLTCEMSDGGVLKLTVFDGDGGPQLLQKTIDPVALGIFPSAADGYLVPVATADDKSAIYLGRRVETESYVAGLWQLDVSSGVITEVADVRAKNLYQYEINTKTKTLVGVNFTPPENLGADPTGPSSAYAIDLTTGHGRLLFTNEKKKGRDMVSSNPVVENPMVSDDGTEYAYHFYGTNTSAVGYKTDGKSGGRFIEGLVKDWFGDTMVVDRDGNLFLYDLATKAETQLTHETDATVEYLGVVK